MIVTVAILSETKTIRERTPPYAVRSYTVKIVEADDTMMIGHEISGVPVPDFNGESLPPIARLEIKFLARTGNRSRGHEHPS